MNHNKGCVSLLPTCPHLYRCSTCSSAQTTFISSFTKKKKKTHWIYSWGGKKLAKFYRNQLLNESKSCITPVSGKNNRFCFGACLQIQPAINNKISCWVFVHGGQWLPDFSGVTLWWMKHRCRRYRVVDGTQVPELFAVSAVNHRADAEIWLAI